MLDGGETRSLCRPNMSPNKSCPPSWGCGVVVSSAVCNVGVCVSNAALGVAHSWSCSAKSSSDGSEERDKQLLKSSAVKLCPRWRRLGFRCNPVGRTRKV